MRASALAGSNMENYEMQSLAVHVEEGSRSGPVVNSPRQLWSVAGYLSAVLEGVFGVAADGNVTPKLPRSLVPQLFGDRTQIVLEQGRGATCWYAPKAAMLMAICWSPGASSTKGRPRVCNWLAVPRRCRHHRDLPRYSRQKHRLRRVFNRMAMACALPFPLAPRCIWMAVR